MIHSAKGWKNHDTYSVAICNIYFLHILEGNSLNTSDTTYKYLSNDAASASAAYLMRGTGCLACSLLHFRESWWFITLKWMHHQIYYRKKPTQCFSTEAIIRLELQPDYVWSIMSSSSLSLNTWLLVRESQPEYENLSISGTAWKTDDKLVKGRWHLRSLDIFYCYCYWSIKLWAHRQEDGIDDASRGW